MVLTAEKFQEEEDIVLLNIKGKSFKQLTVPEVREMTGTMGVLRLT